MLNQTAEELLMVDRKLLIGKNYFAHLPIADSNNNPLPEKVNPIRMAMVQKKEIHTHFNENVYLQCVLANKRSFPISLAITPIYIKDQISSAVIIFQDISIEVEADRAKTEFVSIASHELNTPLGIMKWTLEAMKGDADFVKYSPNIKKLIHQLNVNNERLIHLVSDLLMVAKIESGNLINNPKTINLQKLTINIIDNMKTIADQNSIKIRLQSSTDNLVVFVDETHLRETLQNLISNAIKYSPSGGLINVSISTDKLGAIINVKDNGIGIAHKDFHGIYTKFFRADNAKIKDTAGTGLGLYSVYKYVTNWGGKVWFESKVHEGSTFSFTIPKIKLRKDYNE
jgi:two-component system phosphate regulon sensor histidine kinase PhoR